MHEANCASLCNESWTVVIAAVLGFGIVLANVLLHPEVRSAVRERQVLGKRRPFNFTATWASNFTVAGAILGPILSANSSSATPPPFMPWHSYQLLSILFGAAIVLAPFVYRGRVLSFLVATALTLAAVIGQALTAGVITYALGHDAAHNGEAVFVLYLFLVAIGVGAFAIVFYVWRGIPNTIQAHKRHLNDLRKAHAQRQTPSTEEIKTLLDEHDSLHSRLALELPTHEHFRSTEPQVPLPT